MSGLNKGQTGLRHTHYNASPPGILCFNFLLCLVYTENRPRTEALQPRSSFPR